MNTKVAALAATDEFLNLFCRLCEESDNPEAVYDGLAFAFGEVLRRTASVAEAVEALRRNADDLEMHGWEGTNRG